MATRFWKRIRILPGVTLNLSKGAVSISLGPPGLKFTFGTAGTTKTVGGWGTGLFWTKRDRRKR